MIQKNSNSKSKVKNPINRPVYFGQGKVFSDCDKLLKDLVSCLNYGNELLQEKYKNIQKVSDVKQGVVYNQKIGIYLPLSLVNHTILYNGYEAIIYDAFHKLYVYMAENLDNKLAELAYRTLLELSFYRLQILMDAHIALATRDHFKLVILLTDYATMSETHPEHAETFQKLLTEFGHLLTQKEKTAFELAENELASGNPERKAKATVSVRKLIQSLQSGTAASSKNMDIFPKTKMKGIFSAFSHMGHGNALLLTNAFGHKRNVNQHRLRTYSMLFFTGVNTCNTIAPFLGDKKLIEQSRLITTKYQELTAVINDNWRILEREG